jgi:hypothetical protein
MAEEILVKEPLEKEMIEAGNELIRRLAKNEINVVAALWLWTMAPPGGNLSYPHLG